MFSNERESKTVYTCIYLHLKVNIWKLPVHISVTLKKTVVGGFWIVNSMAKLNGLIIIPQLNDGHYWCRHYSVMSLTTNNNLSSGNAIMDNKLLKILFTIYTSFHNFQNLDLASNNLNNKLIITDLKRLQFWISWLS